MANIGNYEHNRPNTLKISHHQYSLPHFYTPRPNKQALLRLFCFPYAGGSGVNIFHSWVQELPAPVELCFVEFPGHGRRLAEPLCYRMSDLVDDLFQGMLLRCEKPCAFFGHSLGALVSFELARQLRRANISQPVHMWISGCAAPNIPRETSLMHTLPESEFLTMLRTFNGTPDEVLNNTDVMALMVPILRADFTVLETYIYDMDEPLKCSFTALGGLHDKEVSLRSLNAWQKYTIGSFKARIYSGEHFFIHSQKQNILRDISLDLTQIIHC